MTIDTHSEKLMWRRRCKRQVPSYSTVAGVVCFLVRMTIVARVPQSLGRVWATPLAARLNRRHYWANSHLLRTTRLVPLKLENKSDQVFLMSWGVSPYLRRGLFGATINPACRLRRKQCSGSLLTIDNIPSHFCKTPGRLLSQYFNRMG